MNPAWREKAACKGTPPEFWHPDQNTAKVKYLKAICQTCPVGYECLEHWLRGTLQADHGVWFATTPKERRGLKVALREPLGIVVEQTREAIGGGPGKAAA